MGECAHGARALSHHRLDGLYVNARGREQRLGNAQAAELGNRLHHFLACLALEADLARKRVSVGMQAARCEAHEHVALAHLLGVEHLGAVDDTHAEAGKIVIVRIHDAGMLGHLAADERAAGLPAALTDPADDLGNRIGVELAHGNVVQEEQRLGARCQDIVGAHGHEVDAHRVMLPYELGDLELRTDAVGARHENRVLHVLRGSYGEQPAEPADIAHHFGAVRGMHGLLDGIDRAGALLDINARLGIGNLLCGPLVGHRYSFLPELELFGNR